MTAQELAKELGRPVRWVYRNKEQLRFLEFARPIGFDRYAPDLVAQHKAGQRVVNFGAGRLKERRAS